MLKIDGDDGTEFCLDDGCGLTWSVQLDELFDRWRELPHCLERRQFIGILAGEVLLLPPRRIEADSVLLLSFMPGLPRVSSDVLTLEVSITDSGTGQRAALLRLPLEAESGFELPQYVQLDLGRFAGKRVTLEVGCGPGAAADPSGDWLAFDQIVLASGDRLQLVRARGNAA
jgi:hypothetical protein